MAVEQRGPAVCSDSNKKEGKGGMTKTPISLQDLRRSLYVKAKAEPTWRFWGLYVHVCKMETLQEAYWMAKSNDGAPGIDGVTFEAIEESGRESFLKQIQDELVQHTYQPMRVRKKEIPKDGGNKVRVLSIPTIRDRGPARSFCVKVFTNGQVTPSGTRCGHEATTSNNEARART